MRAERLALESIVDRCNRGETSGSRNASYGMLMGPTASKKECVEFRERIRSDPRNYIAQPRIELSGSPTWTRTGVQPRRVDCGRSS
jgi:uncharacterized circularly permuted ATP-grasp superfamily protein